MRTSDAVGHRCVATARTIFIACTWQAQNGRCIESVRVTVIAVCAHTASAESPMHRNYACDRHRSTRTHCKRRIADASKLRVRPSSQNARTMQALRRQYIASEGLQHARHCKRCAADASQVRVRPSSQHARTMKAVSHRYIASARATVIAACAHAGSDESPMHHKCARDRHHSMRAITRVAVIAGGAQFLIHYSCMCVCVV